MHFQPVLPAAASVDEVLRRFDGAQAGSDADGANRRRTPDSAGDVQQERRAQIRARHLPGQRPHGLQLVSNFSNFELHLQISFTTI